MSDIDRKVVKLEQENDRLRKELAEQRLAKEGLADEIRLLRKELEEKDKFRGI